MADLLDFLDGEREKKIIEARKRKEEAKKRVQEEIRRNKLQTINFPGFDGKINELIEAVRTIANYQNLKGFIRSNLLPKHPGIDYRELSILAGVHPGVALVILYDLYLDKQEQELKELEEQILPNFDDLEEEMLS
ncbi:MAG: hypothetical protein ACTSQE_01100 [Candidatus Heimdallarchaeaceae archaeon]